ncbi:autotransporter outer membrane beta-barrel domain-containing protein [Campylobacter sp. MG1]|uniref:autotransporter outer membrane beta-barrel domain-containing protein n=1 Tax=Campylobacter sp. MG1 TaxID=2976332 RepID=UPI00226D0E85|nr:autotransporter outer membrane beta-barrel domain-containing protein [Campylobacter sp. MG1]
MGGGIALFSLVSSLSAAPYVATGGFENQKLDEAKPVLILGESSITANENYEIKSLIQLIGSAEVKSSDDAKFTFKNTVKVITHKDNNNIFVSYFKDNGSIFDTNNSIALSIGRTFMDNDLKTAPRVELLGSKIVTNNDRSIQNLGGILYLNDVNIENKNDKGYALYSSGSTGIYGNSIIKGNINDNKLAIFGEDNTFNAKSSDANSFYAEDKENLYIKGDIRTNTLNNAKNFAISGNVNVLANEITNIENAYIGGYLSNGKGTLVLDNVNLTQIPLDKAIAGGIKNSITTLGNLNIFNSNLKGQIASEGAVNIINSEIERLVNGSSKPSKPYTDDDKRAVTLDKVIASDSVTNHRGDINANNTTFKKGALADNLNLSDSTIYSENGIVYEAKNAINFNRVTSTIDDKTNTKVGEGTIKAKELGTISYSILNQNIDGDNGEKELFVKCSTLTGGLKNIKNLRAECSRIVGGFKVDKLNAKHTTFILGGTSATYNGAIQSTVSTSGMNNTIGLVGVIKDNAFDKSLLDKNLLLAKLVVGDGDAKKDSFINSLVAYKGISAIMLPKEYLVSNEENGVITYSLDKDANNTKASENDIDVKDNIELKKEVSDLGNASINKISSNVMFVNDNAINSARNLVNHIYYSQVLDYNNLNKRLGDLRNNENSIGFWSRAYTAKATANNSGIKANAFIFGADKKTDFNGLDLYTGVLAEIGHSYMSNIDSSLNQYGFGVYASFLSNDGLFVDTTAKIHHYKNKFKDEVLGELNDSGTGFIISAEIGKRFGTDYYLEPSFELIGHYVPATNLSNDNVFIKSDSKFMIASKFALFAGAKINDNISIRTGFGGVFDLRKSSIFSVADDCFKVDNIANNGRDKRYFVNIGTNLEFGKNIRANIEFEKSIGSKLGIDYQLNANIRYSF